MKAIENRRIDEPLFIKALFGQKLPFRVSGAIMDEQLNRVRHFLGLGKFQPKYMVIDALAEYMEVKITVGKYECLFEECE